MRGGGGGNSLTVYAPNAKWFMLWLGDDLIEEQYTENGEVTFKNLKAGTWTVLAANENEIEEKNIMITDEYSLSFDLHEVH